MRFLTHLGHDWLQGSWSSHNTRNTPAGYLTSAFCALQLYFAPLENKVQALQSSFITLAAIGDRGLRTTIVPNTI